jgi:hypothetical protein
MNIAHLKPTTLALSLLLATGAAFAQTATPAPAPAAASAAVTPAKKELVARLLKAQQPGIEALARNLAEQPAGQLLNQAGMALQARVAPEKREAIAKEIGADVKKYADEAVPLVRERAIKLAPSTVGKLLEEKFSEDELKQIVAMLESPVYAKYMQLSDEMQKSLLEKLVAETRPTIEPKIKALEASIGKRLGATPAASAGAKPAAKPPAK